MKRLLFLLLLPAMTQAQIINASFNNGTAWLLPMYNDINLSDKTDTSQRMIDVFGNITPIRIVRPKALASGAFFDNGKGYLAGRSMYPDTVARYGSYNSGLVTWQVLGLDDSSSYDVTIYGSRARTDGQVFVISSGKDSVVQTADTNKIGSLLRGLRSKGGKLSINIRARYIYSYVNAIQLIGTPKKLLIQSVPVPDSATIHSPNSIVKVASASTGPVVPGVSLAQVSGPTKAIFSYGDAQHTFISGLFPGAYVFSMSVQDAYGNMSTATFPITVQEQPRRYVTGMTYVNNILTFLYSDGKP